MQINDQSLTLTFNMIDIDQNHTLDAFEVQCGINLLMRAVLPRQVLRLAHLQSEQIVMRVVAALVVLLVIFSFLFLSFYTLLGGKGGSAQSIVQSVIAGVAAIGVKTEEATAFNYE